MKRDVLQGGELTPPFRFDIDYVEPEGAAAQFITVFYHFRCEDPVVRDIQPAAVGHLALFPRGKGRMSLPDGGHDVSHEVNLLTPFARAAQFEVDGPFHAIGAALTPLGWAALTGMHAQEHANRLYAAADWLPPAIAETGTALCNGYRVGSLGGKDCMEGLERLIMGHVTMPSERHLQLMATVGEWLAGNLLPDVEDLYTASALSRRQTQRLVQQYFGLSPVALRRKYRALRAAAALSQPDLPPEDEAAIHDAFYDQPHMIHEIREFVGRTPARLGDDDAPYLKELTAAKNLRELRK
ncbi:helix-turn-helix domain-containing protein [Aurantiacibacter poecillastricola]|uniref:helix-turn-helix domain-containing protein n=1 Tax=Aurantiacibacter poecillastricola TaxID=3064385 RepID=UPI00273E0116|nr:helix-turn-helix domain-containing protein [Aurantiacibacter sp. 219JJ12-13]MDP5260544.1 helix-turn-helix domain-containing protein [Aurantiacibacter sp. 219JJ12-13]